MKKMKLMLVTLLLLPSLVLARSSLEGNMTGGTIIPSTNNDSSTSDNSCVYYFGFSGFDNGKPEYMTNGLRVTFFDEKGKQVGNTVDVWYWLPSFEYDWISNETLVEEKDGFRKYSTTSALFTPYVSKYEYVNDNRKFEIKRKGNTYTYYYDVESAKFKDPKGNSLKSPFSYYFIADHKSYLKEYFTTQEVVERYMKIANVDSSISISLGNYVITLEPMIRLSRMSCTTGIDYSGRYTITEIAKLGYLNLIYIDNNNLSDTSKMLYLEKDLTIGSYTFKAPTEVESMKKNNVKNLLNDQGIAIAAINGSDVCYPNCKSTKKYKIVYHTINLANPFVKTDDGTNRVLSDNSNWYQKEDTIDTSVYSKEPMLTITLGPSDITKIREYNKAGLKKYNCTEFKNKFANIFSNQNFC